MKDFSPQNLNENIGPPITHKILRGMNVFNEPNVVLVLYANTSNIFYESTWRFVRIFSLCHDFGF